MNSSFQSIYSTMNALQAVGCSSSKKETDNQWKENSNTHTQESKEKDAEGGKAAGQCAALTRRSMQ